MESQAQGWRFNALLLSAGCPRVGRVREGKFAFGRRHRGSPLSVQFPTVGCAVVCTALQYETG